MTAAQIADLRSLSEDALEPQAFAEHLSRDEADRRIRALRAKLPLMSRPPHPQ